MASTSLQAETITGPKLLLLEGDWHELLEPFEVTFDLPTQDGEEHYLLRIEPGFCSDLGSTPEWARSIVGPKDLGLGPTLAHDLLYACQGRIAGYDWGNVWRMSDESGWEKIERMTKVETDLMFRRLMGRVDVHDLKMIASYCGVLLYGHYAWLGRREGNERY